MVINNVKLCYFQAIVVDIQESISTLDDLDDLQRLKESFTMEYVFSVGTGSSCH